MKKLLMCLMLLTCSSAAYAQENASLAFVSEFVRELDAIEKIRSVGEQELKENGGNSIAGSIRNSTRVQLELGTSIEMLKGIRLKPPTDGLPQQIIAIYKQKIDIHQALIDIASQFTATQPKPGVDYGKLSAEMPKITASLEFIDETLYKAVPVVFGSLIDMRPDSQGHASHLVITKAERQKLIHDIKSSFGSKLREKNQNYIVGSASVLLAYLQKDFKCSDEPW